MYLFDPSLLDVVLATVLALAVALLAAWAATRGTGSDGGTAGDGARVDADAGGALEGRQKAVLWTAAVGVVVFLVWWMSLPGPSAGGPAF